MSEGIPRTNNRRQSNSFKLLGTSPVYTPEHSQIICDDSSEGNSHEYYLPTPGTNRRFTRKNNLSNDKSSTILLAKNNTCRMEISTDRTLAS